MDLRSIINNTDSSSSSQPAQSKQAIRIQSPLAEYSSHIQQQQAFASPTGRLASPASTRPSHSQPPPPPPPPPAQAHAQSDYRSPGGYHPVQSPYQQTTSSSLSGGQYPFPPTSTQSPTNTSQSRPYTPREAYPPSFPSYQRPSPTPFTPPAPSPIAHAQEQLYQRPHTSQSRTTPTSTNAPSPYQNNSFQPISQPYSNTYPFQHQPLQLLGFSGPTPPPPQRPPSSYREPIPPYDQRPQSNTNYRPPLPFSQPLGPHPPHPPHSNNTPFSPQPTHDPHLGRYSPDRERSLSVSPKTRLPSQIKRDSRGSLHGSQDSWTGPVTPGRQNPSIDANISGIVRPPPSTIRASPLQVGASLQGILASPPPLLDTKPVSRNIPPTKSNLRTRTLSPPSAGSSIGTLQPKDVARPTSLDPVSSTNTSAISLDPVPSTNTSFSSVHFPSTPRFKREQQTVINHSSPIINSPQQSIKSMPLPIQMNAIPEDYTIKKEPDTMDEPEPLSVEPASPLHTLKRNADTMDQQEKVPSKARKRPRREDPPLFAMRVNRGRSPLIKKKLRGVPAPAANVPPAIHHSATPPAPLAHAPPSVAPAPIPHDELTVNSHALVNSAQIPPAQPEATISAPTSFDPAALSITGTIPFEEITRRIANFLFQQVVVNTDIGVGSAGDTANQGAILEIEARIGHIIDRETNERLRLPVSTECIIAKDPSKKTSFESSMTESHHRALNEYLNSLVVQSVKQNESMKSRQPIVYQHTKEIDTFYELPQAGLLEIPSAIRKQLNARFKPKVRITHDQKTGKQLAKIIKGSLGTLEIYSPMTAFDWRVSVNVEMKYDGDIGTLVEVSRAGRRSERIKDRVSYRHVAYQIDLTQVAPSDVAKVEKEHELEIELSSMEVRRQGQLAHAGQTSHYEELIGGFVNNVRVLVRQASSEQ
ncbi:MAG: mRNA-capping enzyme subunit beta [Cirrosporium novae-zelandiae]|nr:MAG: mRNA-capping enzyme subunit beta [Cirrosporium novae-zelandiae]